jgi:hypothetical protein
MTESKARRGARLLFRTPPLGDNTVFPSGVQWSPDASCIATAEEGW